MNDSARDIWNAVLVELQHNYQISLRNTFGIADFGSLFVVGVPNVFVYEYLEHTERLLIEQLLSRLLGYELKVFFCVARA